MSWAKLDDHFPDHPKVRALGVYGIALQTAAICYCARYLTDGHLSFSAADHLIQSVCAPFTLADGRLVTPLVTSGLQGQDAREWDWKARMLEAGLWDTASGGYRVHDYLVYNPTRASVLEDRAKSAERVRRFRGHRPDGNAVSNAVGNAVTSGEVRLPRTRTRTPKNPPPSPLTSEALAGELAAVEAYRGLDVRGAVLRCEQYWLARGKRLTKRAAVNWLNKDAADRVNGTGPVDEYAKFPGARRSQ